MRNKAISLIRMISVMMIISCHIFQVLNMQLAQWFNVGVQVFLCISGYLYGQKNTISIPSFYYRRFKKILVPYYLVYIPFGAMLFLFARDSFSPILFLRGLFLNTTIKGAGHLWFVPTILMCYFITPILEAYRDEYENSKRSLLYFEAIAIIITSLFFGVFDRFFNPAWICCYIIGYILGINERTNYLGKRFLLYSVGIIALLGNSIQIYCSISEITQFRGYSTFANYNHLALGVFLFILLKKYFDDLEIPGTDLILNISDKYSYEVYLVHAMIILGPFSLISFTQVLAVNIILILGIVAILAWLLKILEGIILQLIEK